MSAPRVDVNGRTVPVLGGIHLLAKLGQGGMGAVYYGIHPRLKREVAVKVLPFHLAQQQPGLVQRFIREAQIAAKSPLTASRRRDRRQRRERAFLPGNGIHRRKIGRRVSARHPENRRAQKALPENTALADLHRRDRRPGDGPRARRHSPRPQARQHHGPARGPGSGALVPTGGAGRPSTTDRRARARNVRFRAGETGRPRPRRATRPATSR